MSMPEQISQIISFLEQAGLSQVASKKFNGFGDQFLIFEGCGIQVRIIYDRDIWFIEVADPKSKVDDWYDVALLRDLLGESGNDVLTLPEQVAVLTRRWNDILNLFKPEQAQENYKHLEFLREERAKRRFLC